MSATKLEINEDIIKKQLLLSEQNDELETLFPAKSQFTSAVIKPKPGICVKTKNNETNDKVFINVCISDAIPAPEDITSEELVAIFESDNPSDFKIPMSIGAPSEEMDKGGSPCIAYDVIINPAFFDKMNENPLFHNFFMVATIEGIDEKYVTSLNKNCWTVLNKKYHGSLPEQMIRTPIPLIQELSGIKEWKPQHFLADKSHTTENEGENDQKALITEITTKKIEDSTKRKKKPKFSIKNIFKTSSSDDETSMILEAEIHLPEVVSGGNIRVSIGEDRMVVESEDCFLDEFLPYTLNGLLSKAFFIKPTRVLLLRISLTRDGQKKQ